MPGLPFVLALKIRERVVALKAKLDALSLGIYVGHFLSELNLSPFGADWRCQARLA